MNLLLHIVAKDVRRMWLPTALWLGFVAGAALYFALLPGIDPLGYDAWLRMAQAFALVVGSAQFFVGFVLTGVLVLEDPVIGADAFWPTRPISGALLLGAKVLASLLLFVVAPALVLLPAWGVAGFSVGEMAWAALEAMFKHAYVTAFALAMGGLAATLAQFLFGGLAVAAFYFAASVGPAWTYPRDVGVQQARAFLVQAMLLPAFVGLAVQQYRSSRRGRGWIFVGCLLTVTALVRSFWPLGFGWLSAEGPAWRDDTGRQQVISEWASKHAASPAGGVPEVRIREGAIFSLGSSRVKILHIVRGSDGSPSSLVLEERDAWLGQFEGWAIPRQSLKSAIRADRYFLRTVGAAHLQEHRQGQRVVHSSLSVGMSWVTLPPGTSDAALHEMVLGRLRYERK